MTAACFEVFGAVQGVGYRYFVLRQAQALALRGSVRNRDDAAVEVRAVGSRQALDTLEAQLRLGPPHAHVRQVQRLAWPLSPEQIPAVHGFTILE